MSAKLISFRYFTEDELEWGDVDLDNKSVRSNLSSESGASKNNGRSPVGGNSVGGSSSNSSSGGFGGGRPGGPGPLGLGDLFAGGIPKLKPVGSSGTRGKGGGLSSLRHDHLSSSSPSVNNSSNSGETLSINSYNSSNSIHIDSRGNNSPASIHMSFSNKPAPPPPPPSNMKPSISNMSSAHGNEQVTERKPVNYGKPSVAPKPPGINGGIKSSKPNPPPKLPSLYIPPPPPLPSDQADSGNNTADTSMPPTPPSAGGSVNRAQSMRMPRTASPVTPNAASIEYRTMGRQAGREFAAMNASGQPPPPPRIIANGVNRVRMSPLRPPSARPPPPPNKAPPAVPPPPPPSSAPPPPRHRISPAPTPPQLRVNGSLGPLPPVPAGGPPPPPPTRNSSMRSVNSATSITSASSGSGSSSPSIYTGVDLESRFGHLFPSLDDLPPPGVFMGIVKTYPSKNAHSIKRQPAPQPPTQMQLGSKMWANNTSTC
ncbi:hypothetical protein Ocin01_05515 [Orchesella cincta]|uniref:WH2 domain-containing protein n=1 Tax=Orchesella cincta TaxID=48709 RepID=A0A1D2N7F9_ORCCI|nr:hypothetical protein Ocin01_05515 [Orchesella cincta]